MPIYHTTFRFKTLGKTTQTSEQLILERVNLELNFIQFFIPWQFIDMNNEEDYIYNSFKTHLYIRLQFFFWIGTLALIEIFHKFPAQKLIFNFTARVKFPIVGAHYFLVFDLYRSKFRWYFGSRILYYHFFVRDFPAQHYRVQNSI